MLYIVSIPTDPPWRVLYDERTLAHYQTRLMLSLFQARIEPLTGDVPADVIDFRYPSDTFDAQLAEWMSDGLPDMEV